MVGAKSPTALRAAQNSEGHPKPRERLSREERDEAMRTVKRQEGGANWLANRRRLRPAVNSLRKTLKTEA